MSAVLNAVHMCQALLCACMRGLTNVCVRVHSEFPEECDITQHGLLLGVLL